MKNLVQDAYKKTELLRYAIILAFGIIANVVFRDTYVAIFTVVAITLAHELPTIFMVVYLIQKERRTK